MQGLGSPRFAVWDKVKLVRLGFRFSNGVLDVEESPGVLALSAHDRGAPIFVYSSFLGTRNTYPRSWVHDGE